ncbi:MAG: hypothetical protein KME26_04090 [Oscillatoria princeps RMCB-10]|nr:hypothetical protein [Oscillatoria princeps RMCB-10]
MMEVLLKIDWRNPRAGTPKQPGGKTPLCGNWASVREFFEIFQRVFVGVDSECAGALSAVDVFCFRPPAR